MEKKNTILLTVIAIATLLVAVVGATFAYFTAQVTTTNNDQNTTNAKTATLASAKMDMGSSVSSTDLFPGAKIVKSVVVTGECGDDTDTCTAIDTNIVVTETKNTVGDDFTWKLYKVAAGTEVGCKNKIVAVGGTATPGTGEAEGSTTTTHQYTMSTSCKAGANQTAVDAMTDEAFAALGDDFDFGTALTATSTDATAKTSTFNVKVDGKTNDRYYLVAEYADNGEQNTQQGKEFALKIDFNAGETLK